MMTIRKWLFRSLLAIVLLSLAIQGFQLVKFISAGPRFTANQGQELCLVVAELAKESYGYRASGKPVPICNYVEKD